MQLLKQINPWSLTTFVLCVYILFLLLIIRKLKKKNKKLRFPPPQIFYNYSMHICRCCIWNSQKEEGNVQFLLLHSDLQLAAWEFALFSHQSGLVLLLKGDNTECQRWNWGFFLIEGWNPCHPTKLLKNYFCFFFYNKKCFFNLLPAHTLFMHTQNRTEATLKNLVCQPTV